MQLSSGLLNTITNKFSQACAGVYLDGWVLCHSMQRQVCCGS